MTASITTPPARFTTGVDGVAALVVGHVHGFPGRPAPGVPVRESVQSEGFGGAEGVPACVQVRNVGL